MNNVILIMLFIICILCGLVAGIVIGTLNERKNDETKKRISEAPIGC